MTFLQNAGLSHSEIFGSKVICTFPKLIAAYHVLHRLREPRHPPCALAYFLSNVLFVYWIGMGIASFYQYCVLEHVRFDIYF